MDIKIKPFILSFGCMIISIHLSNAQTVNDRKASDSSKKSQQQMLKDYFLCRCIDYGFKDDSLLIKKDHSVAVYKELLQYKDEDVDKIKQYAKKIADEVPISDYTGKRGLMGSCIENYRGAELDRLVRSLILLE